MELRSFYSNAQRDVDECSINKLCKNIKKYVKKFFKQSAKLLIRLLIGNLKLKDFNLFLAAK